MRTSAHQSRRDSSQTRKDRPDATSAVCPVAETTAAPSKAPAAATHHSPPVHPPPGSAHSSAPSSIPSPCSFSTAQNSNHPPKVKTSPLPLNLALNPNLNLLASNPAPTSHPKPAASLAGISVSSPPQPA